MVTRNHKDLWEDWYSKYETQNDNVRLAEISSDSESLFEALSKTTESTLGRREIQPSKLSSTGNLIINEYGDAVDFESRLERDFITLMVLRRDVRVLDAQPIQIGYYDDTQKLRSYTPDFHVVRRLYDASQPSSQLESIFVEVKFTSELSGPNGPKLLKKFAHAKRWATRRGWKFAVFTETEIRTGELRRAKQLLPFRLHPEDTELEQAIIYHLKMDGPLKIRVLQNKLTKFSDGSTFGQVLRMLANRQIGSDLNNIITKNSIVGMWYHL